MRLRKIGAWKAGNWQLKRGYLHGNLKGSTEADSAPALPEGYTKTAKAVAEKQGALAGYRLADDIQKYLKFAGPVLLLPVNTNKMIPAVVPKKIGTAQASQYYDETLTVTGKVAQVYGSAYYHLHQSGSIRSKFTLHRRYF